MYAKHMRNIFHVMRNACEMIFIRVHAGNLIHMVYGHPNYQPFGLPTPFADDSKGQESNKNKLVNRAFAYILYNCTLGSNRSCLHELMPRSTDSRDIKTVLARTIPRTAEATKMGFIISPELVATIATYIILAPWNSTKAINN